MFRLVKLAAYALLGYVLYELFLGISEGEPDRASSRGGGQGQGHGRRNDTGVTMSGPGEGRTVPVTESDGGEHNERVGRGVVSR